MSNCLLAALTTKWKSFVDTHRALKRPAAIRIKAENLLLDIIWMTVAAVVQTAGGHELAQVQVTVTLQKNLSGLPSTPLLACPRRC